MCGEERVIEVLRGEECIEVARNLRERELREEEKVRELVSGIIKVVKKERDRALVELTRKFDGVDVSDGFFLGREKLEEACSRVHDRVIEAIKNFKERVEGFHRIQVERSWFDYFEGGLYGMMVVPMDRVGVYVPGGKAAYPSTAIMATVPARIAGVKEVYGFTPPPVRDEVLAAFCIAGVDGVYTIGGAQAIAAAAFGTETVKRVDKIVGPGNIYVNAAKKELFGIVGIDTLAGPSEVLIISDGSVDPEVITGDILAQLEHDEMAKAVLITTSKEEADTVPKLVGKAIDRSERRGILEKSHRNFFVFLVETLEDAMAFSNAYAPEHLEIIVERPFLALSKVKCAGSVFLGPYSPTAFGDYGIGPNHILPTGGAARFSSPLGVYDFYRRISFLNVGKESFGKLFEDVEVLAEVEGLIEHRNSVRRRR